ncbi:MAG: sulfite exporter TauE/SafE family protein [Verrucomicrobiota bacterium]
MTSGEYILAAIAVTLIGFSKAGLGGGTSILATPLMVAALGSKTALGVMLPLLILCDWGACLIHFKYWKWNPVLRLLPSCAVGIAVGTYFLGKLDGIWLQRIIGVMCIGFCLLQWLKIKRTKAYTAYWNRSRHLVLGGLTGLSSTLAHAAGPVGAMYLLPFNFPPRVFVATSVLAFTLVNLLKLPTYFWLGMIQTESLGTSLQLAAFIPAGILLGVYALKRLNPDQFKRVIYVILFLTGLDLLSGKSLLQLLGS